MQANKFMTTDQNKWNVVIIIKESLIHIKHDIWCRQFFVLPEKLWNYYRA